MASSALPHADGRITTAYRGVWHTTELTPSPALSVRVLRHTFEVNTSYVLHFVKEESRNSRRNEERALKLSHSLIFLLEKQLWSDEATSVTCLPGATNLTTFAFKHGFKKKRTLP